MRASRFLAEDQAVKLLTELGPDRVKELLEQGLSVDSDENGNLIFGLEAAPLSSSSHSQTRLHRQGFDESLVE